MATALRFQVFPSSGLPIYRQIVEQVNEQVAGGRLAAGEFLPSVRQVAGELQVNPMTISKAYSLLERDGVVEFVRGHGMRVRPRQENRARLRDREAALQPVLRQLVAKAYQLSLSPNQVKALLEPLLKDLDSHER